MSFRSAELLSGPTVPRESYFDRSWKLADIGITSRQQPWLSLLTWGGNGELERSPGNRRRVSVTGATGSETSAVKPTNWESALCGREVGLTDALVATGRVVSGTLVSLISRSGSPYSVP